MGSATVVISNPHINMADTDKKSLKDFLRVLFKREKKKEKCVEVPVPTEQPKPNSAQAIESILEKVKQLDLKKEHDDCDDTKEDELENFSFKPIKCDDVRTDRSDSQSSQDSGFLEKFIQDSDDENGKEDDLIDSLKDLKLEDGKREKKVQTVVIKRAPIRNRSDISQQTGPYSIQNRHTLTGGQVTVNEQYDDSKLLHEISKFMQECQQTSKNCAEDLGTEWLVNAITEIAHQDEMSANSSAENIFSEFLSNDASWQIQNENFYPTPPHQTVEPNPIEEFHQNASFEPVSEMNILNELLTPPQSVTAYSPMSDSASYRNSEYTYSPERLTAFSPERSSPHLQDLESFQEIAYEEVPTVAEHQTIERKDSTSMTLKQYKDLQKEITQSFSKKQCCILTRKSCKEIFQENLKRLNAVQRKNICLKVAMMDLKDAYGLLQNILISLSHSSESEDVKYVIFYLTCERVGTQQPDWMVGDFGLNLLKSAALRCPHRPVLTRYLTQCVRDAIRHDSTLVQGRETVFHEVDALGDTLLIACVRRGDACADALAEITRKEESQPPLFKVNHLNADGESALHVACSEHSAATPRLHCAHILLEHTGADLWQRDAKAGDTALHMAVNSRTCDLHMVMVLFSHLNRKEWKKLAHAPNTCSKSPLENARSAMKSPSRENYPPEVLEFLKKCR